MYYYALWIRKTGYVVGFSYILELSVGKRNSEGYCRGPNAQGKHVGLILRGGSPSQQ